MQVRPDPKPEKTVKLAVRDKPVRKEARSPNEERAAWFAAVSAKRLSAIWTAEDYPQVAAGERLQFHCHHPIPRQQCRKHGAPEWDRRNGIPVTARRHSRHHARIEPILRSELPDEIYSFLADYPALVPYFERIYPAEAAA
jgi:hypothetical protein